MIEAERERLSRLGVPDRPIRWTYPSTELQIVEIMEGERRGQFLFGANTVSRLASDYRKIRDLPYRKDYEDVALAYGSLLHLTEGFYEYYLATPGKLIPQATFVGRLVESLPDGFKTQRLGQPLWEWIGLLLGLLTIVLGGYGIVRGSNRLARRVNPPLRAWLKAAAPALTALLVVLVVKLLEDELSVGAELSVVVTGSQALVAGLLIWTVFRLSRAIVETIIASPKIQDISLDASLARIAARIVGFAIGGYILFTTLRALGADLLPLLAGLGVGGLAVALAAQRTLANFIGSLILFANQPVRLGDFIRYGDQLGTVEKIGLLATQIRSLERTVVTVPNAEFSEMHLDNFAKRDQRLLRTVLQLRYETTPEQMRYVLAKLRELLVGHPKVTPAPARVRFVGYGAFSKNVEVFAYLYCQDQDTFLAIQEDILLRMEDIINAAGSGFAFPSQTTYLTRDRGLDLERRREAETQVRRWRDGGKLPFPEFEESEGERLNNILDYPPKGSPHYEPPEPPWLVKAAPASQTFQENDLLELPGLVAKLREPNPLSDYLRNQLSEETRKLLSNYEGGLDDSLKSALVDDLNAVLTGPALHDPERFSKVRLSASTQELLDRHPEGEDLVRLNRLLLEDAYPKALGGRTQA
jgi:MscS family membrane protein